MLRTSETETEILLGNKQLAGIFFAGAVLLGVAFYGGYKVGQAGTEKKIIASTAHGNGGDNGEEYRAGGRRNAFVPRGCERLSGPKFDRNRYSAIER